MKMIQNSNSLTITDRNGNTINTISRSNAGTSGNIDGAWITNNLISSPPPIEYGQSVSKSNAIYIPWTYPTQINVGFLNK